MGVRRDRSEEGVSELVGAMLLIGLTVIGVALVGIVFLSSPQSDAIPRVSIAAGVNETGRLVLVHDGGDPLRAGEYRIYVENESGLVDRTDAFTGLKDGAWSVGGNLVYNGPTPERVVVTAVSGGTETILAEPEFRGGIGRFSPDPVGPGVTPVVTPGDDGGASPVQIVFEGENQTLQFADSVAAMKANVTLQDVDRVDFLLYPLDHSHSSDKETLKRRILTNHNGDYVWSNIPVADGLQNIKNGDKVVMIAVVYDNKEQVIGVEAQVATVTGLKK